jgi:hypothetical protein
MILRPGHDNGSSRSSINRKQPTSNTNIIRRDTLLAALTTDPGAGFAELTARYQADPRLTVPATVYNGVLKRVDEV